MVTKQPADKSHFILPDLGEGVHEAELIKWKVSAGETVQEHQTLAEMETDRKSTRLNSSHVVISYAVFCLKKKKNKKKTIIVGEPTAIPDSETTI